METKYTYRKSDGEDIWTVGHDDNGKWIPESDWESEDNAINRRNFLNYSLPYGFTGGLLTNLRKRIAEMARNYRAESYGDDQSHAYHRGAADACGLILDLPELRLFLPAKDGGE